MNLKSTILAAGLCLLVSFRAFGQPHVSSPSQVSGASSQQPAPSTAQIDSGPVAVPTPTAKAQSYYQSGVALWIVETIWGLLIPAIFLFTGFSARLRNRAQRLGRKWFFVIAIYFAIFAVITFVIDLPLSYYRGFVREHAFGLSDQTFRKWFGDELKSLMVGIIIGALFLWVPYLLLKRSPRRWWLYTGLSMVPFLFVTLMVSPIWIDPLFNDFGPMENKALEEQILHLASRAGIEGSRVYEVNKSVDTRHLNAYVAGLGGTKRIVLWDTAIAKLTEPELLFVMGHEMGHYALGHTWQLIVFISLFVTITLYLIHRTAGWMIARYRYRFGFDALSDIASLPLMLFLFGVYQFAVTPAALAFTRHVEHEADRFGLEITQDNRSAATAFAHFVTNDLDNPRPGLLVRLWRANHPTTGDRIDFANEYRPWEHDQPLKYGHLFHETD